MDEPIYTEEELLRTVAALVDAAGGAIVVEPRHMHRATQGHLVVRTDPGSGAIRYERLVAETWR